MDALTSLQQEEDNELAVFIRMDYLPIGFDENTKGGVPIQGKESFTKLYNAYKRVRNLTGRVQDKWPYVLINMIKIHLADLILIMKVLRP
jgi:hypothetical protein